MILVVVAKTRKQVMEMVGNFILLQSRNDINIPRKLKHVNYVAHRVKNSFLGYNVS